MAEEVDYDSLSDEDFLAEIEKASYGDTEQEEEVSTEEVETEEQEEENIEDTDQKEESEESSTEEDETNQTIDDEAEETFSEDETETEEPGEENTQMDDDSKTEDENESSEDETETETEPEENSTGEKTDTEEVNYKEQYEKLIKESAELKTFHDEVTSEFVANGKKMKGFDDPKKIIQSMQMAAGFSDKMAGFKPYRPFMSTLKEKGMLEDPEKFNLAMSLLDGDSEALKQHLKNLEIDPFEMDMENINYQKKNQVSSNIEIAYDDLIENAKRNNIDTKVQTIIGKDWDDKSVVQLLEDAQSSADLVNHVSSGAYDLIQDRISDKKRTDPDGVFSNRSSIEQYREAAGELEREYNAFIQNQDNANNNTTNEQEIDQNKVEEEKARIEEERKNTKYRTEVEKQNAKADAARKKATSVSRKKPRSKPKKKVIDPGELSDEEFTKFLDDIQYS